MTADAEAGDADAPDLSAVMEYMQRNNLAGMKLEIRALNVEEHDLEPAESMVLVAEQRALVDDSVPSDLGLGGVFLVFEY